MDMTDYRALLIDCDHVLVDRSSGIWSALQPMLQSYEGKLEKQEVLGEYEEAVRTLYPRFSELGFSGLLCFAHRQLAESLGLLASWEEGMTFARSAANWPLFEDAPGAMLYLRKFYRLLVYGDRDAEDRVALCERLGVSPEDLISLAINPLEDREWLQANGLEPKDILLVSSFPAGVQKPGGRYIVQRGLTESVQSCAAEICIRSMMDLVARHQCSLRR